MNKQVIGYTTYFGEGFLDSQNITLEELLASAIELKAGVIVSDRKIKTEEVEDSDENLLFNMLAANKMTIVEFIDETGIAKIMYEHPVPLNVFDKFKGPTDKPIFEV